MSDHVTLTADLTQQQALALAQLAKRLCWSDIRSNAVDDDEAYEMRDAIDQLRKALVDAGYNPR